MGKTIKDLGLLTCITFLLTALVWLPHSLKLPSFYGLSFNEGFNTIYRNYDGLEYVVIAKTFYRPEELAKIPQPLPPSYYASHFPGYSLVIVAFAPLIGFLKSMVFTSLLFTVLSALMFYQLVKDFRLTSSPLTLSILFLILPARWLIVHSVGSSEPMFLFFTLAVLFAFLKYESTHQTIWIWSAAFLGIALQLTRPPGILLFIALSLYIHWRMFKNIKTLGLTESFAKHLKYYPLVLMPLALLSVFYWFQISLHDFFAYFHSGDNIHLTFPPFPVFNKNQLWVGEIWLEDVIYIFILGLFGGLILWKQKLYAFSCFVLIYLLAVFSVAHRDIARYALPIFPFLLIAFEKVLVSKEFKIVVAILSLAIYLYAQNFLLHNSAPVADLTPFN